MDEPPIIRDLLESRTDTLTAAERKVAAILRQSSIVEGLHSITRLAESAGVSTPTVIRLARKLGFDGFPALQHAIRAEVAARMKQPLAKFEAADHDAACDHIVARFAETAQVNLNRTLDCLNIEAFDAVAALLSDPQNKLSCVGGRITRSIALYLASHLQIIRANVALLDGSPGLWAQSLLDMDERTVLILFDIRRYEKDLLRLAKRAKTRGATIVLVTDLWGSPVEAHATHSLRSAIEAPSSWDSTLAMSFLVEALIAAVQMQCSTISAQRLSALEEMIGETRIFGPP